MPCEKVSGVVLEQITADAIRWGVDLIVLGPRGRRGIGRVAMGSDAENVLRLVQGSCAVGAAVDRRSLHSICQNLRSWSDEMEVLGQAANAQLPLTVFDTGEIELLRRLDAGRLRQGVHSTRACRLRRLHTTRSSSRP